MVSVFLQYDDLISNFKTVHKDLESVKMHAPSTVDIKKDIAAMQEEKEQLARLVERRKKKVEAFPNRAPMLEAAKRLRVERDRESNLQKQIHEQRNLVSVVF